MLAIRDAVRARRRVSRRAAGRRSRDRQAAGAHDDRRSADGQPRPVVGLHVALRRRARDRQAAARAARAMVDAAAAAARFPTPSPNSPASPSRTIRSRATCSASTPYRAIGTRARAQRHCCPPRTAISRCRAPTHLAARSRARAWIDAWHAAAPALPSPDGATRTTSSTPPTSGTASSGTGALRRSVCSRDRHRDG